MPKIINIGQCFTELFKKVALFLWTTVYILFTTVVETAAA